MIRIRNGKFWKVGRAKRDFRGPGPKSVLIHKGAMVLYREKDHLAIFPGDPDEHTVHSLSLTYGLIRPAWIWRRKRHKWSPVKVVKATVSRPFTPHGAAPPDGLSLIDFLLENPKVLEEHLGKEQGWVERLLTEDREAAEELGLEIEWDPNTHKLVPRGVDASVPFKGKPRC